VRPEILGKLKKIHLIGSLRKLGLNKGCFANDDDDISGIIVILYPEDSDFDSWPHVSYSHLDLAWFFSFPPLKCWCVYIYKLITPAIKLLLVLR
jgi:hypothetical protein